MFYVLSQILDFLVTPSDLIALLGGLGLLLALVRRRKASAALIGLAAVLLLVGGYSPLGAWALGRLEDRFPQIAPPASVDGIILLGGTVDAHITEARGIPTFNDAGERLTNTAVLALRYPQARVILAGGGADTGGGTPVTESKISKDILTAIGLAQTRIELEEKSRNTCEDAAETASMVGTGTQTQTWLLVTSASHMPRAMACFRAAGFPVVPFPVDYRTKGTADYSRLAPSVATGLTLLDLAAHEWVGLLTYRLTNRTSQVFPAP